jgi:hypothetical protein
MGQMSREYKSVNAEVDKIMDGIRKDIAKALEKSVGDYAEVTVPPSISVTDMMKAVEEMSYEPKPHLTHDELDQLRSIKFPVLGVDFGKGEDFTTIGAMSRKGRSIYPRGSAKLYFQQAYANHLYNANALEIQEDLRKVFEALESLRKTNFFAELKEPVFTCKVSKYTISINPTASDEDIEYDIHRQIDQQEANRAKNRQDRRRQNQLKGRKRR